MSEWDPYPRLPDASDTTPPQVTPDDETLNLVAPERTMPVPAAGRAVPPTGASSGLTSEPASGPNPTPDADPAPGTDAAPVAAASMGPALSEGRGVRIRTIVVGLVMLTISIVTLVALTTGVRVDGSAIGLLLLLGAGAVLVAGGAASAMREARGGPGGGR